MKPEDNIESKEVGTKEPKKVEEVIVKDPEVITPPENPIKVEQEPKKVWPKVPKGALYQKTVSDNASTLTGQREFAQELASHLLAKGILKVEVITLKNGSKVQYGII